MNSIQFLAGWMLNVKAVNGSVEVTVRIVA